MCDVFHMADNYWNRTLWEQVVKWWNGLKKMEKKKTARGKKEKWVRKK